MIFIIENGILRNYEEQRLSQNNNTKINVYRFNRWIANRKKCKYISTKNLSLFLVLEMFIVPKRWPSHNKFFTTLLQRGADWKRIMNIVCTAHTHSRLDWRREYIYIYAHCTIEMFEDVTDLEKVNWHYRFCFETGFSQCHHWTKGRFTTTTTTNES